MPRQERETGLSGEPSKALCISRLTGSTVSIEVEPGLDPGIPETGKAEGIVGPGITEAFGKCGQGGVIGIPIESRQENDIGINFGQDADDRLNLLILSAQNIPQEKSGAIPGQWRGESRNSRRILRAVLGKRGTTGQSGKGRADQETARDSCPA